jgi:hypothetical protein
VGPRAGLYTEAKGKILSSLPGIEPRFPGRGDDKFVQNCNCKTSSQHFAYALVNVSDFLS